MEAKFRRLEEEYKGHDAVVEAYRLREKLKGIGEILKEKLGYQSTVTESARPELIDDPANPRIRGNWSDNHIDLSLKWWKDGADEANRYGLFLNVSGEAIIITFGSHGQTKRELRVLGLEEEQLDDALFESYADPVLPDSLTKMA